MTARDEQGRLPKKAHEANNARLGYIFYVVISAYFLSNFYKHKADIACFEDIMWYSYSAFLREVIEIYKVGRFSLATDLLRLSRFKTHPILFRVLLHEKRDFEDVLWLHTIVIRKMLFEWLHTIVIRTMLFEWLHTIVIRTMLFEWLHTIVIRTMLFEWLHTIVIRTTLFEWLHTIVIRKMLFEWLPLSVYHNTTYIDYLYICIFVNW